MSRIHEALKKAEQERAAVVTAEADEPLPQSRQRCSSPQQ